MCGVGLGLTMQLIVLATQNAVPTADLGVATSSVNFFRSIGGSIGVAALRRLFNARLAAALGVGPADATGATLPAAERATYVEHFADALTGTFLFAVRSWSLAVVLATRLARSPCAHAGQPSEPCPSRRDDRQKWYG